MNKWVAGGVVAGSLLVGGAVGAVAFGPSLVGAQTTTTPPNSNSTQATPHSNEDPNHEASESTGRESAEDSDQFQGGGHGPNEDPNHEANESSERESAEDSGQAH